MRILISLCLFLMLSGLSQAVPAQEPSRPQGNEALPANSPKALPQAMSDGAAGLKKEIAATRSRTTEASEDFVKLQQEIRDLQVEVTSLKAFLTLQQLPLSRVQELLRDYGALELKINSGIKQLTGEVEKLKAGQEIKTASLAGLEAEMSRLRDSRDPAAWFQEIEQSYQAYSRLAAAQERAASRLLELLQGRLKILQQKKGLLDEVLPRLKNLEESWRMELLKRQEQISIKEQVMDVWQTLTVLPWRGQQWLFDLLKSGRLGSFIIEHAGLLIGFFAFITALGWTIRRLNRFWVPRLESWQHEAADIGVQGLFRLGLIFMSMLFPIGLILWVGLAFRTLGLLETTPALVLLYTLITLVALRLLFRLVHALFGGKGAEPLLPLEGKTARFYRRRLKAFSSYVLLGVLGLLTADLLGIPASIQQFVKYLFETGLLIWNLVLIRRYYLEKLLPELLGAKWLKWTKTVQTVRGMVLALLSAIILTYLLGFQSLSVFIAQSAALTEGVIILWGLLSLVVRAMIHYGLHAREGWLGRRYPSRSDLLERLCSLAKGMFQVAISIAALLAVFAAWGIRPEYFLHALNMLTWGITLGPVRLTPLNVVTTILVFYFGIWFSRFVSTLLQMRIFPRTGWDIGIQYTISTILQYVIVILGVLLALNVLGFPLANLAIIMGALGVGIGLGLQNIVSNFISGLVLLIERPIKVGDMLVIDGQWGEVKEIRMRSTVFQTFDRYVLIIPNSELTSTKILNWTHFGRGINRITLKVGVSYDADVKQVTQLLTEICKANPRVLDEPAPRIFFEAYGESSLNFNIWVHVRIPDDRIPTTHELNSAIFNAFREHGIEIPYPKRDLHIKGWPEALGKGETRKNDDE